MIILFHAINLVIEIVHILIGLRLPVRSLIIEVARDVVPNCVIELYKKSRKIWIYYTKARIIKKYLVLLQRSLRMLFSDYFDIVSVCTRMCVSSVSLRHVIALNSD